MATFSEKSYFEEKIDIDDIASRYEIAGGAILNVVQYCSLMAISRNDTCIRNDDLIEGIRREFEKEGRVFV
jgi:ATP-dependent 26S proteasome regulatory subunit